MIQVNTMYFNPVIYNFKYVYWNLEYLFHLYIAQVYLEFYLGNIINFMARI